jgi:hypothetical protein
MKTLKTIFMKLGELSQKKDSPGYLMQLFSIWASLFFAALAIYLTIELDKADKKTEKLTQIVMKLDTTNQQIIFSQKQNDTIIQELFKQNLTQNSQLKSLIKQYNITKDKALFENQKSLLEYERLVAEFREFAYVQLIFRKSEFLNLSPNDRKLKLNELSKIIDKVLLNPIVYSNKKYYSDWTTFNFWYKTFYSSMSNYPINSIVNITYEGEVITSGELYLNKVFDRFSSNLLRLENNMDIGTIEWEEKYLNIK